MICTNFKKRKGKEVKSEISLFTSETTGLFTYPFYFIIEDLGLRFLQTFFILSTQTENIIEDLIRVLHTPLKVTAL
jgi:hypothetical protein